MRTPRRVTSLLVAALLVVTATVAGAVEQRPTERLAGGSRYDTAVQIAQRSFADGADVVYLARAVEPLVDAVAGGVLTDGPVLLVPADGPLPDQVVQELSRLDPGQVMALGGPDAVSDAVLADAGDGRDTGRLSGNSRYETAVEIATRAYPSGADTVYLARATEPLVDAVAGGAVTNGPILLVPGTGEIPNEVRSELIRLHPASVIALGGPEAISDQVLRDAAGERPSGRLAGGSRYDTAIAISQQMFADGATRVYLARAIDPLVDAVAGGSLVDGPTLLVPPDGVVPGQVLAEIDRLDPDKVVALGGPDAISDTVLAQAGGRAPNPRGDSAPVVARGQVTNVVDGDTLDLDDGTRIRLAIADAPETDTSCGPNATGFTRDLVAGQVVAIYRPDGAPRMDRFGRTVGEVVRVADGASLNVALVGAGLAEVDERFTDEDPDLARRLRDAAVTAPEQSCETDSDGSGGDGGGGGAGDGGTATSTVSIADVREDGPGNDVEVYNDSEYVELTNAGDDVDISGWQVVDAADNRVVVGQGYVVPAGGTFRIYSGAGDDDPRSRFYAGRSQAYLNNSGGDTIRLLNAAGAEVDTFSY